MAAVTVWCTLCHSEAVSAAGQVVVTHLQADAVDVREVDWTRPTAIVLGNEHAGERYFESLIYLFSIFYIAC